MIPEGSLLCLQEPVAGPYSESYEFNSHLKAYFPNIDFNIIFQSTPRFSEKSLIFSIFNQNFLRIYYLPHAC